MKQDNKKELAAKQSSNVVSIAETAPIVNTFDAEGLIKTAIKQKVPVETMERLLVMRRELKAEWAKEQYDKAMAAFQSECPVIEKKKKVSFGTTNYSYAPLEEIVEQVKELLSKNGFSYTFDTKEGENAIKVICYAKHIAGHSESSSLEIEVDGASKMNKTQQYGSANSYGKRYAFCNAFGILTGDEDTDAAPIEDKPGYRLARTDSRAITAAEQYQENKSHEEKVEVRDNPNSSQVPATKQQLGLVKKLITQKGIQSLKEAGIVMPDGTEYSNTLNKFEASMLIQALIAYQS